MDLAIMSRNEIEVPKELREFMIEGAEETFLGQKNGATKQYRYGNLHIREYDDKFLVHVDKADPRKDPLGHLVLDAPEFLVGVTCAVFGGPYVTKKIFKNNNPKNSSISSKIATSILAGCLGYAASKKLKEHLE